MSFLDSLKKETIIVQAINIIIGIVHDNDFNLKNTGLKADKEYISNFIQDVFNDDKYASNFTGQCKDYVANEEYCPITEIVSKELIG